MVSTAVNENVEVGQHGLRPVPDAEGGAIERLHTMPPTI